MDSDSSDHLPSPKRLKTLACNVAYSDGNNLLHQFVLDNSNPNHSGPENYINGVLLSMSGISVNKLNDEGYSALHLAVLKNNLLMVKKLLSCFKNINVNEICKRSQKTALHLASKLGHSSIVQELLNKGASVDKKSRNGDTALCFAAQLSNTDILKLLVEKGANVNLKGGGYGLFPLHHAVKSGNVEAVKFLVNNGANLSVRQCNSDTVLHYVATLSLNVIAIVEFLVSKGADVNAKNKQGRTPLHEAVHYNNLAAVEILVAKNADVNAKDTGRGTPLHSAVCILETEYFVCEEASIDVNAIERYANIDIHDSAKYRHEIASAKLFVSSGADLNAKNEGLTLFYNALFLGFLAAVKILIDNGADVNAKDRKGETPLHYAAYKGKNKHLHFVQLLLERGANANSANIDGWTPLHFAAYNGYVDVIRALLDKGADVNAKNKDGKIPLELAKEFNKKSCIKVLESVV